MDKKLQYLLHYKKALAFTEIKKYEKAIYEINSALNIDNHPLLLLAKGKILAQQKQFHEAIEILQQIPETNENYKEAKKIISKIRRIENPLALFIYNLKESKLFFTFCFLIILLVSFGFITNYFYKKQQNYSTQNFIQIQHQTQQTSNKLNILANQFESTNFIEKEDLLQQQKIFTDTISSQINSFEKALANLNKIIERKSLNTSTSLDSMQIEIKKLIVQVEEIKQHLF